MKPILSLLLAALLVPALRTSADEFRNSSIFLKSHVEASAADVIELGVKDMFAFPYCFQDLVEGGSCSICICCSALSIGCDLEGRFYDFKRTRSGRPVYMDKERFTTIINRFVRSDWNPLVRFGAFYRSPTKLYTGSVMIPSISATSATAEFGEPDVEEKFWLCHYKGKLTHREKITFRFRGMGDDILVVRVDGKIVLAACSQHSGVLSERKISDLWKSSSRESRKYRMGSGWAEVGDWITLSACEELDMEVIVGHVSGYHFGAMLAIEEQGIEYPEGNKGNPILPMFKTIEPSTNLVALIQEYLTPDQISITNGPVFCY